jgi:hypothetical protein
LNCVFFVDEAWFDLSGYITFKNSRVWNSEKGVNEYGEESLYMYLRRRGKLSVFLIVFDNNLL